MITAKGKTTLMIAAQTPSATAHLDCAILLARSTAQLNCRDHKGRTALMLAARCGSDLVVEMLIEAGAELETVCEISPHPGFVHGRSIRFCSSADWSNGNRTEIEPPSSVST